MFVLSRGGAFKRNFLMGHCSLSFTYGVKNNRLFRSRELLLTGELKMGMSITPSFNLLFQLVFVNVILPLRLLIEYDKIQTKPTQTSVLSQCQLVG